MRGKEKKIPENRGKREKQKQVNEKRCKQVLEEMIGEIICHKERIENEKQKEEEEKLWRNGTINLLRKRKLTGKMKYRDRNKVAEKATERKPSRKAKRRAPVPLTHEIVRNGRRGEEKERGDLSIKRGERENVTKLDIKRTVTRVISPNIQKLRKVFESEDISTVRDFSTCPQCEIFLEKAKTKEG